MLMFRTWKLGIKSLLLHPMRSALTVLGIFIGVASVIWLLAIGEGISKEAQRQIEDLGAENIIIRSIKPPNLATVVWSAICTTKIKLVLAKPHAFAAGKLSRPHSNRPVSQIINFRVNIIQRKPGRFHWYIFRGNVT